MHIASNETLYDLDMTILSVSAADSNGQTVPSSNEQAVRALRITICL